MELDELKEEFKEVQKIHNNIVMLALLAFLVVGCLFTILIIASGEDKSCWILIFLLVLASIRTWRQVLSANERMYELENDLLSSITKAGDKQEVEL